MKQAYSNANFTLLGLIAEAATGMPFESLFDERIVQALGLEATHFARGNGFGGVVVANSSTIDDKVGSAAAIAAFDELTLAAACR